ncbi:MAG: gluconate kinase [Chitinophagaceae bacterium]|nr:MAG: gluconate kinase [Chitinophagaceae bacterium]
MQYIIGIDIGTTHTKAVVTSANAEVLTEVKAGYPSFQPAAGYHEQDPRQLLEAVIEVLSKAVHSVPEKENILVVSFSAAMHSLMAVDRKGQPLTNLWTWADTRSQETATLHKNSLPGHRIYQQTGTPIHPMSPLCKIAWMRTAMPEVFAAAHKFISGKEYIIQQLTGHYIIDTGLASATGLLNVQTLHWSNEALEFAGISEEHLSVLAKPTDRLPALKEEYVKLLNLPADTVFINGGSDGSLANIGAGAVLPGEAALTIGTSGAVRILSEHAVQDHDRRLFNYRLDETLYLPGGAVNNGGLLLQWFIDIFTDKQQPFEAYLDELLPQAGAIPPGAEGLIFLPYIHGERAPVWDAAASGMFVSIKANHTRAHYLRAVLEGVAFSLLQIIDALQENGVVIEHLFAGGGFINSPEWLRIVTDVSGKTIHVSHAADASAMGAIYMGMKAAGLLKEWKDIKQFMQQEQTLKPNRTAFAAYEKNYLVYKELYRKFQ